MFDGACQPTGQRIVGNIVTGSVSGHALLVARHSFPSNYRLPSYSDGLVPGQRDRLGPGEPIIGKRSRIAVPTVSHPGLSSETGRRLGQPMRSISLIVVARRNALPRGPCPCPCRDGHSITRVRRCGLTHRVMLVLTGESLSAAAWLAPRRAHNRASTRSLSVPTSTRAPSTATSATPPGTVSSAPSASSIAVVTASTSPAAASTAASHEPGGGPEALSPEAPGVPDAQAPLILTGLEVTDR